MIPQTQLILASASPRRKALLDQIGLNFEVVPSHVHEPPYEGHDPQGYARGLATLKASEISREYPDALVVGADTIVVVGEAVLGKPVDEAAARGMLEQLSGRTHEVITAYTFSLGRLGLQEVYSVCTRVRFKTLKTHEIKRYIFSGGPFDKAGAYGIQDYSSIFVDEIRGCFYNVVGLPISDFNQRLEEFCTTHSISLK